MLNRSKVLEYFDGTTVEGALHIVGCGAIGSHIAESLARMGCINIHLWDFDTVSPHNITNQMFNEKDIGVSKVDAVYNMMTAVDIKLKNEITIHDKGWQGEILNGYVFLCVDSIDIRKQIVKTNEHNPNCKAFFDFRMRLTDAQHYAANRDVPEEMERLIKSMDFTHEEAKAATPTSACGVELSVIYTVKTIAAVGLANFVRCVQDREIKHMILINLDQLTIDSFPM